MTVQTQEYESTSETGSFVAVVEPLGSSETNQVGGGKVCNIRILVVCPTLQGPCESGAHDVLVKNKTPVLDRLYAVRRPGDREMALTIACDALKAIEAGAFYRNPGWQCSGCPFRTRCGM